MDAAVPVDAKNAPTGTWKTAKTAVSHTAHTHHRYTGEQRQKNRAFNRLTHEIPDTPSMSAKPAPRAHHPAK
jgi:hypothetical protein